jgi:hypothetical protein
MSIRGAAPLGKTIALGQGIFGAPLGFPLKTIGYLSKNIQ